MLRTRRRHGALLVGALVAGLLVMPGWAASADDGPTFADVTDPAGQFYDYIEWMSSAGISTGTPQSSGKPLYKPADSVSRQAMAAFLYRLSGDTFTAPATATFADYPVGSQFFLQVEWMASRGISTGTPQPEGKPLFNPSAPVSRQAMALFLARYAGADLSTALTEQAFADVPLTSTPAAAIDWMRSTGISIGTVQTLGLPLYKPADPVSRQAMAAFLYRLAHLPWNVGSVAFSVVAGSSDSRALTVYLPSTVDTLTAEITGDGADLLTFDVANLTPSSGGRWSGPLALDAALDAAGTYTAQLQLLDAGAALGIALPITITVSEPDAATIPASLSAPSSAAIAELAGAPIADGEIDVQVRASVADPDAAARRIASANGAVIIGSSTVSRIYQLRVSGLQPTELSTLAATIATDADVESAFLALLAQTNAVNPVNDPLWSGQWTGTTGPTWGQKLIDAPQAWAKSTGSGVKVGVIDAGFDTSHEDLAPNISSSEGTGNRPDHGTHTAGTVCAKGNNGIGIAGIAYNCSLNLHAITSGATSVLQMREAMARAAASGSRVVNISYGWGSGDYDCLSSSLTAEQTSTNRELNSVAAQIAQEAALHPTVLWVFAAGNGTSIHGDGFEVGVDYALDAQCGVGGRLGQGYPNIISVAAVDESGNSAVYSNFGSLVTVAAPGGGLADGEGVQSTIPGVCSGSWVWRSCTRGEYGLDSGTSMAAPMVTGVAALVIAANGSLSAPQVRECIVSGAEAGGLQVSGQPYFVVNANESVDCAQRLLPPAAESADFTIPTSSSPGRIVIDDDALRAYVVTAAPTAVSVVNLATNTVVASIDLAPYTVRGIAINRVTHRLFVVATNTVREYDTATLELVDGVGVSQNPYELAVDETNNILYVTHFDGVVERIPLAGGVSTAVMLDSAWGGIAVDPSTGKVYVGGHSGMHVLVAPSLTTVASINAGFEAVAVNPVTHEGYSAWMGDYFEALNVISSNPPSLTDEVMIGPCNPIDIEANTALDLVYVLCAGYPNTNVPPMVRIVDGLSHQLVRTIPVGPRPASLAVSEQTGRLYVSDGYSSISLFESPW